MEQDKVAFPFARADMAQAQRVATFRHAGQFVIVRREQGATLESVVHRLDHRPGQRHAVISRGPAPDLVQDDEAVARGLSQDGGGFDHFDHEGRLAACQIVRGPDAAEQAIGNADGRAGRGYEAAGLGHQDDEGVLAQEGRLAAHIRSADQPDAFVLVQGAIVGDEAITAGGQRLLDDRVPPAFDIEHRSVCQHRSAPFAIGRTLGPASRYIDPSQRLCGGGDRFARFHDLPAQILEMRFFCCLRVRPCLRDATCLLVQAERVEPYRARHRLAMGEAAVRRHQRIAMPGRNLDKITKHLVVLDFQRGDTGVLAVLSFQRGNRAAGVSAGFAQCVERVIVA